MTAPALHLVYTAQPTTISTPFAEKLADHQAILEGYFDTYITRGFSDQTLESARAHLTRWFRAYSIPDATHPAGQRQLFVWEAMEPFSGRERIIEYSKCLVAAELARSTVRKSLTSLSRLFAYVLGWPYLPRTRGQRIETKYGALEQPVLAYDYPKHVFDADWEGNFLSEQQLDEFYTFIHDHYVQQNQKVLVAWRDYSIVVLLGESGFRARELCGIDALGSKRDLFYDEGRIRTRHGKGFNGSGPLERKTIFTPFAQEVIHGYERLVRPHFRNATTNPALFLSEKGTRLTYPVMYHAITGLVHAARQHGLDIPEDLTPHDFRRSFATNFNERQPAEIAVLMALLGHRRTSSLYRYVRPSQRHVDEVLDSYTDQLVRRAKGE